MSRQEFTDEAEDRARTKAAAAQPRPDAAGDTRLALILAAERIFSAEGITSTSLRRINQAAGQRNESAIHYYFGSREGLVAAILELRTAPINEARTRMIRDARKRQGAKPLESRDIAEAIAGPLIDHLRAHLGETCYLRFQCMLWLDRPVWKNFVRDARASGLKQAQEALIESRSFLPEQLVRQRFGLALQMVTNALARIERVAEEAETLPDPALLDVEFVTLVDAVVAIFDAAPSPELVAAMRRTGEA
ncbi:MAG: TetR family transcriptional regulator [Minwuia sp.]|uniref:TetR family transcriptional regulator n=1 Tax=Minwuia sp. TaxID=2493630 RepID=UPI003A8AFED8